MPALRSLGMVKNGTACKKTEQTSSQTSQRGLCGITVTFESPATPPPLPHTLLHRFLLFSLFTTLTTIFFQATRSSCRTFKIPWTSTNLWTTTRLTNHLPCWCSVFTNDSDYTSPRFPPNNNSSSPSKNASGADENNNIHLDNLRCSRLSSVVSNYPSPPMPSSPQPTFDPTRLSINFSQTGIPQLFSKS